MAVPSSEQKDALISQFCSVAGTTVQTQEAEGFLAAANWSLEEAVQNYFAANEAQEGDVEGMAEDDEAPSTAAEEYTGPRTLDGRPAPPQPSSQPSEPASSSRRNPPQRGMRTLKDLQGGASHSNDDDDDDDENSDHEQDLFAGGEKSGLAVQNPGQAADPQAQIRNMIKRAGRNAPPAGGDNEDQPRPRFTGTGQTLGGDDAPSRVVTEATPQKPQTAPPERRDLHIWKNGFSVDDGPLYRYDDPANSSYLEQINRGQAPIQLMNATYGQELDVHLSLHREEDYVKPKAKYKPFGGSGQRLGSPTPGAPSPAAAAGSQAPPAAQIAPTAAPTASPSSSTQTIDIDESQPTVALQFHLGDGSRLRSRFNATHTIGDVYNFVNNASPSGAQRAWALMTTFPRKELSDKSLQLGDIADLKRGGVVVQKWT